MSNDTPYVSATGTSKVEVTANTAIIVIEVERRTQGREACEDQLRTFTTSLTHVLTSFDATVDSVRTLSTTFSDDVEIDYWTGRNTVKIEIGRFDRMSDLFDALRHIGPARIYPPLWSLKADDSVWALVRRDAARDAVARCRVLAEATGVTLGGLLSIADHSGAPEPVEVRIPRSGAESSAFDITPSQLLVAASVEVRYALPVAPGPVTSLTGHRD